MNYALLLVVLLAGIVQPFQTAMNTKLFKVSESPNIASAVSYLGAAVVVVLFYAFGILGRGKLSGLGDAPWWSFLTGPLGVLIVIGPMMALPKTSVALVIATLVFGQGVSSLLVDHFGWLDVKKVPINPWRIAGVVLLLGGVLLMQKK